jgi:hypothetical protein
MKNISLSEKEIDYLLSPTAIRDQAQKIFDYCRQGKSHFEYHPEKFESTVEFVIKIIQKNYPDLNIPFHSRWGHFRAGGINRVQLLDERLKNLSPLDRARTKLDLVITSVLLDAGAGTTWKYDENGKSFARSEGLGVASFHMFLSGIMSSDQQSLQADAEGLAKITHKDLEKYFQVSDQNPLIGVSGRVTLLNNLQKALSNKKIFSQNRPGNILDYLRQKYGQKIPAEGILRAVLDGLGPIWPGRINANGINLGDVWQHSKLNSTETTKSLVPLHKLSQWMTYSLIEPILEAGFEVTGVEHLTGLAEYRNGGLMIDSGLLRLKNPSDALTEWTPDSDLIIEWRALTVFLLDKMGSEICKRLNKTPQEFPLAKVLEGGTWWAGRALAQEKREGATPPLKIKSDGTVF